MQYNICGRHLHIRDDLNEHVRKHLDQVVQKYARRPTSAHVTFSKSARQFVCEVTVHLSTGLSAQAKAQAQEIYPSFDLCCEKLEKQLRRYKRRLNDHHKTRSAPVESFEAPSYILASSDNHSESEEPESLQPVIIAEIETKVPTLVVGEAVMQMELAGASPAGVQEPGPRRRQCGVPARRRKHRMDRPSAQRRKKRRRSSLTPAFPGGPERAPAPAHRLANQCHHEFSLLLNGALRGLSEAVDRGSASGLARRLRTWRRAARRRRHFLGNAGDSRQGY